MIRLRSIFARYHMALERTTETVKVSSGSQWNMLERPSLLVLFGLCALMLILRSTGSTKSALTWDVFGYYLYLPAYFIHDDIALQDHAWLDQVMATYEPSSTLYQLVDAKDGARVIKYSSGMAIAYAPFFFAAHAIASPLGYAADGFSEPYRWLVTFGALIYILIGLTLFRRVLMHFFTEGWSAVLLTVIVLGTNYFQLAAFDGTLLTHPFLFTLCAALILLTIKWHERPEFGSAFLIGAVVGFMTLVRPSEVVYVLIPVLWATHAGFLAKWRSVAQVPHHILIALVGLLIFIAPQLFYWHAVTGNWVFYSYVNPGEGLDLGSPHVKEFLFSFRKGWFVYTPLMFLAVTGLISLWHNGRHLFWAVLFFLIADVYLISSWTNWWYAGGSFSARAIVPAYVLLAIPLGFLLRDLATISWARTLAMIGVSACVVLNLFQTWQWNNRILSKERMTAGYYAAIFARTTIPDGAEQLLSVDRSSITQEVFSDTSGYVGRTLFLDNYDDRPNGVRLLDRDDAFASGPDEPFSALTKEDHVWIRATARLWVGDSVVVPPLMVISFHHKGDAYKYRTEPWVIPPDARNEWITKVMDYLSPEVRDVADNVKMYIWNQAGNEQRVDDLRVDVYERK
jgi:hypothetical protein